MLCPMTKIPEILVRIQMERPISVSSNPNIQDHLWSWSTSFAWKILTEICCSMARTIPIRRLGLIRKCCSIFLRYSNWSLTSRFGIMENIHNKKQLQLASNKNIYCIEFKIPHEKFWTHESYLDSHEKDNYISYWFNFFLHLSESTEG